MAHSGLPVLLTLAETIGLLQRFMLQRDAKAWLENDRRYSPLLPFITQNDEIFYPEDAVLRFVAILAEDVRVRQSQRRTERGERRQIAVDRRAFSDRRHARRRPAVADLDRRFAVRQDRRSDLDRRIRGWVDRRCIDDRRSQPLEPTNPIVAQRPAGMHRASGER